MAPEPVPMSAMRSGCFGRQTFQDGFDEELGLGARDQDGRGDAELEAVELLLAGDVLDGLAGSAAVDGAVVGGLLGLGERAVRLGEERGAREVERV